MFYNRINKEKTQEEYEEDMLYMEKHFGNEYFTCCIDIDELDEPLTDKKEIIIKNTYDCYCWDGINRPNDYFIVKNDKITNRFVINQLIKQNFNPNCNHCFLEDFHQSDENSTEFICVMGS